MKNIFKQKRGLIQPKTVRWLFFLPLLFLIVVLVVSNIKISQRRAAIKDQIKEREDQIAALSENDDIDRKEYFDDYEFEKIAREQLLMKREGEEVVFITPEKEELPEEEEEEGVVIWWNPLTWIKR